MWASCFWLKRTGFGSENDINDLNAPNELNDLNALNAMNAEFHSSIVLSPSGDNLQSSIDWPYAPCALLLAFIPSVPRTLCFVCKRQSKDLTLEVLEVHDKLNIPGGENLPNECYGNASQGNGRSFLYWGC